MDLQLCEVPNKVITNKSKNIILYFTVLRHYFKIQSIPESN